MTVADLQIQEATVETDGEKLDRTGEAAVNYTAVLRHEMN